ncbi:MAG TPA: NrfD/PsrC family molybdoenzyme membrane anchor subunit, partial [Anaeromyxobacteraceae bacterium]|nr:NrfD/PsrC family molybdoenzyme membrane anchor subunit [Anaeromyxobacteraceae bacterium]
YLPAYFYVGGAAGAAAALGAAAQLATGKASPGPWRRRVPGGEHRLVGRCRFIATGGAALSAVLLIADLGKPMRFLNMLRVFRPTSPMNMGTWILSAFGGAMGTSALPHLLPADPLRRRISDAGALAGGLMGLPLCTYTGVLVANTAVPIWQQTRRTLPVLFAASGTAGAASLLELWPPGGEGDRIVRRYAIAGKAMELLLGTVMEREARAVPRVARPLGRGASGALWRASKAFTLAGLVASAIATRRSTGLRRAAGVLGTLGSLSLRFAIMEAGRASARDPHATFDLQRAGRGARDVVTEKDQVGATYTARRQYEAGMGATESP